jgi:tetratricopeptide (TPR) repeat protein
MIVGSGRVSPPGDRASSHGASRNGRGPKTHVPKEACADSLKEIRVVRELLRQLGASERLRRDPVASPYVAPREHETDHTVLTPLGEELVRSVIGDLPSRSRIVLERTELLGQSVAEVARELAISERQVYRDRALALQRLADCLSSQRSSLQTPAQVRPRIDAALSLASMLEQVGQFDRAAAILSEIAASATDSRERASAYCVLARLALEQGSTSAARSHAELAISSAIASDGDILAHCEADSLLGAIALTHGRSEAAALMLRRSCTGLRSLLYGPQHDRSAEALARALLLLSQSYDWSGAFEKSRDAADEARLRLHEMSQTNALLSLEARIRMAMCSHFIGENVHHWESELRACYETAIKNGFILLGLDVAAALATFYKLSGATGQALELLEALATVCKNVAPCRTKAVYYASFATLLSHNGNVQLAESMLDAFRSSVPLQPDLEALFYLIATRTKLAAGSPVDAIDASTKAQLILSELGRTGLIGVTLQLRSVALSALGRHREAFQAARDAVDALWYGHPRSLRLAQETLARVKRKQNEATLHASSDPHG